MTPPQAEGAPAKGQWPSPTPQRASGSGGTENTGRGGRPCNICGRTNGEHDSVPEQGGFVSIAARERWAAGSGGRIAELDSELERMTNRALELKRMMWEARHEVERLEEACDEREAMIIQQEQEIERLRKAMRHVLRYGNVGKQSARRLRDALDSPHPSE